jgi:hypothetical protein
MSHDPGPALLSPSCRQTPEGSTERRRGAVDGVICFSHLRWDFVYQRPQHIMSRMAQRYPVWFVEEPVVFEGELPRLDLRGEAPGLTVVVPRLPANSGLNRRVLEKKLLDLLVANEQLQHYLLWFYTPMSLHSAPRLAPLATVYDCMDELSAFRGAPASLELAERALLLRSDVVFAGGSSLYEAKRRLHRSVHLFPSSVDATHFRRARDALVEPDAQREIPHPRIGFFGVVDERFDTALLGEAATARPDFQFVVIGPVVKIDPNELPRRANIHYLGRQAYVDLPAFLAHWDIAMMPFALNASTRYISPTKTPEYLAGGRLVVSTAIRDVVANYGGSDVVKIAWSVGDVTPVRSFVQALDDAVAQSKDRRSVAESADRVLAGSSWDDTFERMHAVVIRTLNRAADGANHA